MIATLRTRHLVTGLGFLLAYVILDYVSFVKPYRGLGITPWNPPPGLSIAFVFLEGIRIAPFVLIAPALANALVRSTSLGLSMELLASLLQGGMSVAAGLALKQIAVFDPRLRSVRDALILIGVAIVTAMFSALLYVGIILWSGLIQSGEFLSVVWRAAVGELIGILIVTPLVLLAWSFRPVPRPTLWTGVQILAIVAALAIVFGYREATAFQLFYLLFLPVLWIALSDGPPGAVIALLLVQIGLVIGAEIRFGTDPGLGALQVLMIALAITALVVGTIVAEREDTAARMRDQQAALSRALRIRSAGEIAATIAHEMNQPLTALTTYSGIAAKALDDGDTLLAQRVMAKVQSECVRAKSVLTGIRELLRQGTISRKPFDASSMLTELADLLEPDLNKRGIRLNIVVGSNGPKLSADRVQLQQAVHNLIVNSAEAIQSASNSGIITVSASAHNGHEWLISVRDNGPGFPPGYNLLDPTPFTSTKSDGSGIGLAVVRSIAQAHGGSLQIKSNSRGSTVEIRIPAAKTTYA